MIRGYALVVMNNQDEIIDRYNLDLVTAPTGNGFQLELSTIATDIEDVITKVVQKKATINMIVHQVMNGYMKSSVLTNWIQKYSTSNMNMFLEYNDTVVTKYCGGKVTSLTKTEKNEYKDLAQDLTFTMTTPFFVKRENTITIEESSTGKKYPFKYPYQYGRNEVTNNQIDNPYILEVPVIVTIEGAITNPRISLLDENGNVYNEVWFGEDGAPVILYEGEKLVINSAQKKINKINTDGTETDYRPNVNPQKDTYLLAKNGQSRILINYDNAGEGFKLTGGWRQYTL